MAEFDRTKDFLQLVDAVQREFTARNMPLKPNGAKELLPAHLSRVANQLGISKQSALKYLTTETAVELARIAARTMRETEANDDALPPVPLGLFKPQPQALRVRRNRRSSSVHDPVEHDRTNGDITEPTSPVNKRKHDL